LETAPLARRPPSKGSTITDQPGYAGLIVEELPVIPGGVQPLGFGLLLSWICCEAVGAWPRFEGGDGGVDGAPGGTPHTVELAA
jgi:hypothetical protein